MRIGTSGIEPEIISIAKDQEANIVPRRGPERVYDARRASVGGKLTRKISRAPLPVMAALTVEPAEASLLVERAYAPLK